MEHVPAVGEQFFEPALVPAVCQPAQHVRQVRQRRHVVLRAGAQDAVQRGYPARRVMRAREQVVLPPERHIPNLLLADVVVRAETAIVQEAVERSPVMQAVIGRLRQLAARRTKQTKALALADKLEQTELLVPRRSLRRSQVPAVPESGVLSHYC
jgi:hypothetical protein